MIKPRRLRLEIGNDIAQAVASAKMCRRQRDKLREASHSAQRRTDVMGLGERVEFMSRQQL